MLDDLLGHRPLARFNGDDRAGATLFDSLLLNADTGTLRCFSIPCSTGTRTKLLVDVVMKEGQDSWCRPTATILLRSDSVTGAFTGVPFVRQTWAMADARRPPWPPTSPTWHARLSGVLGGLGPRLNHARGCFTQAQDDCHVYYKRSRNTSRIAWGGSTRGQPGVEHYGIVKAIGKTGKIRWSLSSSRLRPAVLSTAGGSCSAATARQRARRGVGPAVWHFQTGGIIQAAPISFGRR